MAINIPLPKNCYYEEIEKNYGKVIIEGCYPGYGTTLGNSLRRVLLSSLPGAAAVAVKIQGVAHEFSTIKGVLEDVVQIILNLKRTRFKLIGLEETTVTLKAKGEKQVTAGDIKGGSEVEIANPNQLIATLTSSSASLDMEIKIKKGIGYVPVEQQDNNEKEVGTITMDAVFTPIRRVNFKVENMRVGKRTDFEKIILEIETDGTTTPKEAYEKAIRILLDQFGAIVSLENESYEEQQQEYSDAKKFLEEDKKTVKTVKIEEKGKKVSINDLKISTRTMNVLKNQGIKTAQELANFSEEEIKSFEGMGEKGLKEIRKALGSLGLLLSKKE